MIFSDAQCCWLSNCPDGMYLVSVETTNCYHRIDVPHRFISHINTLHRPFRWHFVYSLRFVNARLLHKEDNYLRHAEQSHFHALIWSWRITLLQSGALQNPFPVSSNNARHLYWIRWTITSTLFGGSAQLSLWEICLGLSLIWENSIKESSLFDKPLKPNNDGMG